MQKYILGYHKRWELSLYDTFLWTCSFLNTCKLNMNWANYSIRFYLFESCICILLALQSAQDYVIGMLPRE